MHYLIVGCIVVGVGIPVCNALEALLADIGLGWIVAAGLVVYMLLGGHA